MQRSDGTTVCSAADDPTTYDDAWAIEVAGLADPRPSMRDVLAAHGWYIANVLDASWVESSEWGPILAKASEAAAGPRDGCAYQCPHDKATHERYPNDIDHDYVEAAAGPRDEARRRALPCSYKPPHRTSCDKPEDDPVHAKLDKRRLPGQHVYREPRTGPRERLVLPPPDPSLIDTLGEGTDPDRPVRVLADDYPTIEPRRYGKFG